MHGNLWGETGVSDRFEPDYSLIRFLERDAQPCDKLFAAARPTDGAVVRISAGSAAVNLREHGCTFGRAGSS